jgi:hypothetical protein
MNEAIKQKWVKDLKSRKYKQGGNWLHTIQGSIKRYDALGVLIDIYLKDQGKSWNYIPEKPSCDDPEDILYVGLSSSRRDVVNNEIKKGLPPQVMRWVGVKDPYIEIPTLSKFRNDKRQKILNAGGTIAGLDDYGFSFREIAEIIEKTF